MATIAYQANVGFSRDTIPFIPFLLEGEEKINYHNPL